MAMTKAEKEKKARARAEDKACAKRLGKKGGKIGGPARAAKLTKKERSSIARKAANARWKKEKK